ncbi:hypothetical protein PUNSTDRAFT_129524 [Punctularia strigosozonata HHB-11173 SS5]|uniref:uncharacterized protein n=1 Tax=Punctularia strigosozonata (strain HHB-11173) TaxID=741275 RepID=UPI00044181CA|nr:uncharacterized protein PUNSTDRAFT_129524 [Punctularia strigosozonata HHB-11173 SS5]EIN13856.1 hypothetical protein PUNSTDRAFT_129524 [Punctularia strigosozonata HHB-11173 SS5]
MSPASLLDRLPSELYSAICQHLPPSSRHESVLSLVRAIPRSPVPRRHLWECLRLTRARQVFPLYRHLRNARSDAALVWWISVEIWNVDADVLVNFLRLLVRTVRTLSMFIGPTFAPEHMEELLAEPFPELRRFTLRFRPYVSKATYEPFLKGAYFDTTLLSLSRWPPRHLQHLSIVQDPLDPAVASQQSFAQPIVFFRLDPISTLLKSESMNSLATFQLRIPMRQVGKYLYDLHAFAHQGVHVLDLSTCNIYEADVDAILLRFTALRHLILDGCGLVRGEFSESDWANLGRICAMTGMKRARVRERKLKTWLEAQIKAYEEAGDDENTQSGARGATRTSMPQHLTDAMASLSVRHDSRRPQRSQVEKPEIPRVRIIPPGPSLLSLATIPSMLVEPEEYTAVREAFGQGWQAGILQVNRLRSQLRTSWRNGVRILRFGDSSSGEEEGFSGLVDLDHDEVNWFEPEEGSCPVLCLAGSNHASVEHVAGCGHDIIRTALEQ